MFREFVDEKDNRGKLPFDVINFIDWRDKNLMWVTGLAWSEIVPWILVALWVLQLSLILAGMRHRQTLLASAPIPDSPLPRLTVILAARNEEECIETCLRSLVRQQHPNFEIVAVNDRSTDRTGFLMDRMETQFPGLVRVVHVNALPTGWLGKAHAMHLGMQAATGDWICFVDADCEQISNHSLTIAAHEALRRKVDLLSLTPQLELKSVWEQITVPICSWLMMVWFQPGRVNNPKLPTSYANGAFLMVSRKCYDAVGGWARVRSQISEDVAFAKAAKSSGSRLAVLQNEGLYRASMYDSIRESWDGWPRIFYGSLSKTALIVSMIRLIICSIIPTAIVASIAIGWLLSPPNTPLTWNVAVAGWMSIVVFQQIQAIIAFRATGSHPLWSLTVSLGQVVLLGMLTRALLNHFGLATLNWRGAVFYRGQVATPAVIPVHSPRLFVDSAETGVLVRDLPAAIFRPTMSSLPITRANRSSVLSK